jgi:hypothetical protein
MKHRLTSCLSLVSAATFCGSVPGIVARSEAQQRIESKLWCPTCKISSRVVTALDPENIDGKLAQVARSTAGRVLNLDRGVLKLFSSDGRFIKAIGRQGGGPGEFEIIRNIFFGPDETIHVIDAALARHSIFDQNGDFVRSFPFAIPIGDLGLPVVALSQDRMVVNAVFASRADAGHALAVLDKNGDRIKLLDSGVYERSRSWLQWRLLYARPNGELLVGKPWAFSIDVYDEKLNKTLTLVRNVPNRVDIETLRDLPSDGVFDIAAAPRLRAVWEDDSGRLWLYYTSPSPRWKAAAPQVKGAPMSPSLVSRPRLQTVLEVIDLKTNRTLARRVEEGSPGLSLGGGYVARYFEKEDGEPAITITKYNLTR